MARVDEVGMILLQQTGLFGLGRQIQSPDPALPLCLVSTP